MARTRYTLVLNNYPEDAHLPPSLEGETVLHFGFETDLPADEVMKQVTDLAKALDVAVPPA